MIPAWRIVKRRHAERAFEGEGARRHGGRWNSPGLPMVYAAESGALAALEILAGLESSSPTHAYVLIEARFDEERVERFPVDAMPEGWRKSPPGSVTQAVGDRWLREGRSVVLRVPSVLIPAESNYLLNPTHSDFGAVRIEPAVGLDLDPRLGR